MSSGSSRPDCRVLTITLLLDVDRPIEDCEAAARTIFEAAFDEPIVTAGDYRFGEAR